MEPYAVAAVELACEKMVVIGQVAADVPYESLSVGAEVELVVEPLFSDDEGEVLTWKWRPIAASSGGVS